MTSSGADGTILVIGPVYCDLLFEGLEALPKLGTERFARGFRVAAGGSAITAIALARLGWSVAVAADVGDDAFGVAVRDELAAEGVDVRHLRTRTDAPTPMTAVLSTPGDRAFVTFLAPAGEVADLDAVLRDTGARHLHVAGFPAAQARPELVAQAHARGVGVSFDPGWDEAALADSRVRGVARACDVLLPNRIEAARLANAPEADALARLAAERPARTTVVKDGADGAAGMDGTGMARVASPPVRAVDTTGAGDVFDAGFLDAYLSGASLAACLRRGVACGARAVTAVGGAAGAPTRAQLLALDAEGAT